MKRIKKICFVATNDLTIKLFLINHLRELVKIYNLTIITKTDNPNFLFDLGIPARVISLSFSRKINLINDLYCFIKLVQIFLINRFSLVHSITPKAGFLAMLASFLTCIPVRIHSFTGQVWVTTSGAKRFILKLIDKLVGMLATYNLVDSPSQRDFLVSNNVLYFNKATVFGSGSIAGVDISKFNPNKKLHHKVKKELLIQEKSFIFLYLGRITLDKGVLDLAKAFSMLEDPNAFLVIVGPDEDHLSGTIRKICLNKLKNIRIVNFTNDPYKYLTSANVLCLPSYREGFGNVIIEAGAMSVPTIASKIYGITDAIVDNKTGILHKPGDIIALKQAMNFFLQDRSALKIMGNAAKMRVVEKFNSKKVTKNWMHFYKKCLL